ncbi:MAG: hypothetical protein K2L82_13865 [Lachnospiraceae bacterium]|nr:hypothetical protein [Lachnospiraceae bacterium]
MNLMEGNHHTKENNWREDLKSDFGADRIEQGKPDEDDNFPIEDLNYEADDDVDDGLQSFWHKPYMTTVLLSVILVLLICIIVLLLFLPNHSQEVQTKENDNLQQSITQYAQEQKQNDYVAGLSGETVGINSGNENNIQEEMTSTQSWQDDTAEEPEPDVAPVAADKDKTAIVIDVEDENDVSYSKEFILNEALPYFADNNQDAIWDLTHLKRYVKLSEELKGTDQYYYKGDVNSDGRPDGQGLAIYENNSYYYGDWVNGVRSGNGTWYRFYIGKTNKTNSMGKYIAHSYAGTWANNLPNGQGAEHYEVDTSKLAVRERILQNVIGNFTDGLYDGELYMNTVDYTGNVEEWSGVANKGVFDLWRDMSAIGECSVWRKNDDQSLCLDIDKSQNKNQGIRELLQIDVK